MITGFSGEKTPSPVESASLHNATFPETGRVDPLSMVISPVPVPGGSDVVFGIPANCVGNFGADVLMVTVRDADPEFPALSTAVTRKVTFPEYPSGTFQEHDPVSEDEEESSVHDAPLSVEYSIFTDDIPPLSLADHLTSMVSPGEKDAIRPGERIWTAGDFVSEDRGEKGEKIGCGVRVGAGVGVADGVTVPRVMVNALMHAFPFFTTCVRSVHDLPSVLM